ncbi:uncharacterized protein STEHIDRAFT_163469 [Stereum hirsutum FP-91666 SS1]|uniref:Uncharacterized protein n=1 Tax=Stereum hirsutum (strain FP-91666) TaxID=721885 RepID=R7RXM9_STEHR|nr:uncharacterized protein STEHIDRAFT_163469 [Stereum hirsutum FP-91666 SS1]EIM79645.1 hypothetical protein STEHIDRAFT_163469 [Stereum hirsutum FP-91666 SS1]
MASHSLAPIKPLILTRTVEAWSDRPYISEAVPIPATVVHQPAMAAPYTPKKDGPEVTQKKIDHVFVDYEPFFHRLMYHRLSDDYSGGEASLFMQDALELDSEALNHRVAGTFVQGQITVINGSSGSGKSLTCAKGLLKFGGIPLTCPIGAYGALSDEANAGRGSHDMRAAVEHLEQRSQFKQITADPEQEATNRRLVKESCMCLLASHLLVIRKILCSQPHDLSCEKRKEECGIFQLDAMFFRPTPGGQDIFQRLFKVLQRAPHDVVEDFVENDWEYVDCHYPDVVKDFSLWVDEAQALASKFDSGAHFLSTTKPKKPRPLLTPVVEIFMERKIFKRCVISGISVSPQIFNVALQSSTARLNSRIVELTIADGFLDKEEQRRYIVHKLRPWADEIGISEESFDYLVLRMTIILRGRYRLTAFCSEQILRTGTKSPHRFVTAVVLALGNFVLTDGGKFESAESALSKREEDAIKAAGQMIDWDMFEEFDQDTKRSVFEMVTRFLMQGLYTALDGNQRKLIEVGIGHLTVAESISPRVVPEGPVISTNNAAPDDGADEDNDSDNDSDDIDDNDDSDDDDDDNGDTTSEPPLIVNATTDAKDPSGAGAAYLTELLTVSAVMAKYPERVADTLLQGMRLGLNNSMNGFAYEPQISYVAAKVHGHRDKFTSLGNLYQFHAEVAFMADLQVQLVAMFKGPDGKWRATQAGPGFGPSPQMGYKVNSPKEFLEHLDDGGATCIVNPDVYHGGDHIRWYKVLGSKHYIMVVDQAKLSAGKDGEFRPEMLKKALRANDPRRYYKTKGPSKKRKWLVKEGKKILKCFEEMRKAEDIDSNNKYDPALLPPGLTEENFPHTICGFALTGTDQPPAGFVSEMHRVLNRPGQVPALMLEEPFEELFGTSWRFATTAQNRATRPVGRM